MSHTSQFASTQTIPVRRRLRRRVLTHLSGIFLALGSGLTFGQDQSSDPIGTTSAKLLRSCKAEDSRPFCVGYIWGAVEVLKRNVEQDDAGRPTATQCAGLLYEQTDRATLVSSTARLMAIVWKNLERDGSDMSEPAYDYVKDTLTALCSGDRTSKRLGMRSPLE